MDHTADGYSNRVTSGITATLEVVTHCRTTLRSVWLATSRSSRGRNPPRDGRSVCLPVMFVFDAEVDRNRGSTAVIESLLG